MTEISEMVERVAVHLFWKAEQYDPSDETANIQENEWVEWFNITFPRSMSERRREFWRYLAYAAIEAMESPTNAMLKCAEYAGWHNGIEGMAEDERCAGMALYRAMIDVALGRDIA